jgi:hypothetical protein
MAALDLSAMGITSSPKHFRHYTMLLIMPIAGTHGKELSNEKIQKQKKGFRFRTKSQKM